MAIINVAVEICEGLNGFGRGGGMAGWAGEGGGGDGGGKAMV